MKLWEFAVRLYAAPGVARACLSLQDDQGIDVPHLLFAAWAGAELGVALDSAGVDASASHAREWRQQVVVPLRRVRRELKEASLATFHRSSPELRELVKEVELRAEKLELEALEDWAVSRFGMRGACGEVETAMFNVAAVLRSQARDSADLAAESLAALRDGLARVRDAA